MVSAAGETRTVNLDCTDCCQPCTCGIGCFRLGGSIIPVLIAAKYFVDIAGFTDSGGVDCTNTNGTFPCCGLGCGFDDCSGAFVDSFTKIVIDISQATSTWTVTITFNCPSSGTVVYTYTCPVSSFNGCGSVTMSLASTIGSCACGTPPSTIVLRSESGDPCNCKCLCFLNCPDPFPIPLYIKLSNFLGGVIPNATVAYFDAQFPMQGSTFLGNIGCTQWGTNVLAVSQTQVNCNANGTVRTIAIGTVAGHTIVVDTGDVSCSGGCYVMGTGVISVGDTGTCTVETSCSFIP